MCFILLIDLTKISTLKSAAIVSHFFDILSSFPPNSYLSAVFIVFDSPLTWIMGVLIVSQFWNGIQFSFSKLLLEIFSDRRKSLDFWISSSYLFPDLNYSNLAHIMFSLWIINIIFVFLFKKFLLYYFVICYSVLFIFHFTASCSFESRCY